jgi:signal transduction histidine kinase
MLAKFSTLLFFITVLAAPNVWAQEVNYFDELKQLEQEADDGKFIQSIIELPFSQMVDNLYESEQWLRKGLTRTKQVNDEQRMADIAAKLATDLYLQGQYDSSTYYNLTAINLYDKLGVRIKKGEVLCELGYQTKRRDLDLAFKYFREGIALLETNKASDAIMSHAYDNYGVLFELRNDLDSAGFFYDEALKLKTIMNDSVGIPYSLNKIAQLNLIKKNFDDAKSYFDQAYEMRSRLNDAFGLAENETFYGDLYVASQDWSNAIEWYLKSNVSSEKLKYPRLLQYNYDQLVLCYEQTNQYKEALEASRKSSQLKDQLLNEKNSRTILELEERYESAEKDRNISRLETETARKRLQIYIAIALSIIIILIVIAYSINTQRKARAARDAAIIEEREAGLKAVFDATEEERKRIAKDLHDGLGQQLSGLRLSWESIENQIKTTAPAQAKRIHELTGVLDEACTEVRTISHTIMPKALQEKGLLAAIEDMLYKSLHHTSIEYDLQHFRMENKRFQERVELSMYRICQELMNNVIKHSKGTQVSVQLLLNKQSLVMIVEDNGIGMSSVHSSDGIGLMNIQSRVHTINGEAMFEAGPEQGLVVTVRVPVE